MFSFFFFNDTATTEIYTLSLHDALPISFHELAIPGIRITHMEDKKMGDETKKERTRASRRDFLKNSAAAVVDRKSTRLNSSHDQISHAVFCLEKKNKHETTPRRHESR